ncbi:LysR family transcriptional regulator [Paenibacillus amylolyticus]|uniref:LysR family transcriptional regulator n=1 Tax=Paenibacillus amylolyticus TaxID=1451 RepID=UPI00201E6193|nr:LysR family transcriptional regulator [Paenibacillus amylolyticus]MCL6663906.1 LysR family transcriptional regulator [Paenibacillus amylolyticus]
MTLYQLEVFLAVVQTESFTRAGKLLHTSQSGVSHTIADLEKELGIVLFTRNRNRVNLTNIGEQILPHVFEIIGQKGKINQVVAEAKGIKSGILRIGAFSSFVANMIPDIFQVFRSRYPGIELQLFEGSYAEVNSWIRTRTVDLGFLTVPSDGLDFIRLISDPYVAVLPVNHPLGNQAVISMEQLTHEPFLSLKSGCETLVMRAFQDNRLSLNKRLEVVGNSTIISMVEAGIGVSIVPSMILPAVPANIMIKPLTPSINRVIGLAVPSLEVISPAIAAFIKETQILLT